MAPTKDYCACCSRFPSASSVDLCSAQEGNKTCKGFSEGYGILMWKYPAVAKESSHCWSGHGVPCAKERGIQSVKDTDKDLEDY